MCGNRLEVEIIPPIKTMWMSYAGALFERESDAIEHCPPVLVYFCPDCGDWKYTEAAAIECCMDDNPAGSFKDDDK